MNDNKNKTLSKFMITEETILKGIENRSLCFVKKGRLFVAEINTPTFSEITRFTVFQDGYDRTWWCRVSIISNNKCDSIKLMIVSDTTVILIKSNAITVEEAIVSYILSNNKNTQQQKF